MLTTSLGDGKIPLDVCLYNASGVHCTTQEELDQLDQCKYTGAVLTKSCTIEPRLGNDHPRYYDDVFGSINSNGLCNEGYQFYSSWKSKQQKKPYIISVAGPTVEDTCTIISECSNNAIFELNMSCPNIGKGSGNLAYDKEAFQEYLRKVTESMGNESLYGIKLPPFWFPEQFDQATEVINEFRPTFVTTCNSIPNGLLIGDHNKVAIQPHDGFGGIGGRYIKPVTLANVAQFKKRGLCSIVGCGGVSNGRDAFELLLVGADAVQIGTAAMSPTGLGVFKLVASQLRRQMKAFKCEKISDIYQLNK